MRLSDFSLSGDLIKDGEFSTLGNVDSPTEGTLAYCDTIFYLNLANMNDHVACVITQPELADRANADKGLLVSSNPRNAFYELHRTLLHKGRYGTTLQYQRGRNCIIHPTAIISERTHIGDDVRIAQHVVVKDEVSIGDGTFIDAGAVIGAEGLLCTMEDGRPCLVEHAGGVQIGCNAAILSNAVVVKSVHNQSFTIIGDNTVIGIATTIGHDAYVGKNCVILGNCVIARSAHIDDSAWIGSSCVVREHVQIGKFARVNAGSIVIDDVKESASVSGNFAVDHKVNLMQHARMRKKAFATETS